MAQSSPPVVLDVPILTTKDVEKLELESKLRLDSENRGRVRNSELVEIVIDPAKPTELKTVQCSSLPRSYQMIRNSMWIERQPVYKAALDEWRSNLTLFSSKVERKTLRVESLKNEIYNMIGFYSVFQGVLVTASSQSSVLHCRNVGLPVALSLCASIATFFGILQMFGKIHALDSSICTERIEKKKAYEKICRLKAAGELFRFNDFSDSEGEREYRRGPGWIIVTVALSLFSIIFIVTHLLILCRE